MAAFNKVKHYLGLDKSDDIQTNKYINLDTSLAIYGLGKVRTIQEFYDFAGIDITGKRVVKNFCNTDNIASNEDIIGSNKIKETQKTHVQTTYTSYISYYLLSFCILILFIIVSIVLSKR